MTNREAQIKLSYEILMDAIGQICVRGEYSAYELALETLRDFALETTWSQQEIGVKNDN